MVCAASMRSARATLASPKCPTLKVSDQTTAKATTNAAAAENTGRQRTATHSRTGNTRATGNAVDQGPSGSEMTNALNAANTTTPTEPSASSRREGELRTASAIPTSSGATATIPSRQDANQTRHTMKRGPLGTMSPIESAAPRAANAAPSVLATKNPSTW